MLGKRLRAAHSMSIDKRLCDSRPETGSAMCTNGLLRLITLKDEWPSQETKVAVEQAPEMKRVDKRNGRRWSFER